MQLLPHYQLQPLYVSSYLAIYMLLVQCATIQFVMQYWFSSSSSATCTWCMSISSTNSNQLWIGSISKLLAILTNSTFATTTDATEDFNQWLPESKIDATTPKRPLPTASKMSLRLLLSWVMTAHGVSTGHLYSARGTTTSCVHYPLWCLAG